MHEYRIITHTAVHDLELTVNGHLAQGWSALGAPFVVDRRWHQAMTRDTATPRQPHYKTAAGE